jgi:hypothetical protein
VKRNPGKLTPRIPLTLHPGYGFRHLALCALPFVPLSRLTFFLRLLFSPGSMLLALIALRRALLPPHPLTTHALRFFPLTTDV